MTKPFSVPGMFEEAPKFHGWVVLKAYTDRDSTGYKVGDVVHPDWATDPQMTDVEGVVSAVMKVKWPGETIGKVMYLVNWFPERENPYYTSPMWYADKNRFLPSADLRPHDPFHS